MKQKLYEEHYNTESDNSYYENLNTGQTQWNKPGNGLIKRKCNKNNVYYESKNTGETSWTKPNKNYIEHKCNQNNVYYQNIKSGKTYWNTNTNTNVNINIIEKTKALIEEAQRNINKAKEVLNKVESTKVYLGGNVKKTYNRRSIKSHKKTRKNK